MTAVPFAARLAEDGAGDYADGIHRAVHGLWSGSYDRAGFLDTFEAIIDRGLRRAWNEGLAAVGLTEDDMDDEERLELGKLILEQLNYTGNFADFILDNNKASGGPLSSLQYRSGLWINRYEWMRNRAMELGKTNPPMTWTRGATAEGCPDCIYADGKTYRLNTWLKWGWEAPRTIGITQCNGNNCACSWSPAAPGTKLTRGHPRRPVGP